jgi:hypothetical protein
VDLIRGRARLVGSTLREARGRRVGSEKAPQPVENTDPRLENGASPSLAQETGGTRNEDKRNDGQPGPDNKQPSRRAPRARRRPDNFGERGQERKKGPGGRRNPLKRLNPDKEIKVNSFDFLWPGLAGFGKIWDSLGKSK